MTQLDNIVEMAQKCDDVGKVDSYEKWYTLLKYALHGMNINAYSGIEDDGEKWVMNWMSEHIIDESGVIFDVGANIGEYSNYVLEVMGDKVKQLYAFEPVKSTYQELCSNVSNHKAILNNLGLSDNEGEQIIYYDKEKSPLASLYDRKLNYIPGGVTLDEQEIVKLETLDAYCLNRDIEYIDLLKIDVEGNELKVLQGAKKMMDKDRIKAIQFEFGGTNIDARTYFRDFYDILHEKYHIYRILKDGLHEISRYTELLEIFAYSNFFAILK